jgi:Fe-S-cluster-containing hydrogenase component 2
MRLNWFAKSSSRRSATGRALRTVGHSWSASPLRRLAQAAAFVLFLVLFFYVAWPYGSGDFAEIRSRKEIVDIEIFLALDPLVSVSTAIADRAWVWSLPLAGVILAISLVVPRIFCGYLCPMGTTIDLFDWSVSNRVKRFRVGRPGWWRNLRYYVLVGVLTAAVAGVMLGGFVAAIPVVTRGFQFIASPLQTGATFGWSQMPPLHAGHFVSIGLFVLVLGLGLLRPRFWCRHVCPTGAIFSLVNRLRLTERRVSSDCIQCGQCSHVCSFDAINDDFTTLGANCAFCQTCGGVCPVGAIDFGGRGEAPAVPPTATPEPCASAPNPDFSRRGFMIGLAVGAATGGLAATGVRAARAGQAELLVRPPGSAAEDLFSSLCVRCGQCLRVCPNNLLQPVGLDKGIDRLWTPWANTDWAGCDPTCNNCGQVCPTGAIRALTLDAKKKTRMGLAEIDEGLCRPCQGNKDCEITGRDGKPTLICREVCLLAGYEAITFKRGDPGLAPSVVPEQCVGCGLCQAKCFRVNVVEKKLLKKAAIRVQAGLESPVVPASDSWLSQPGAESPSSTTPSDTIDVPYLLPDS